MTFDADIPIALAVQAHAGTSHSPEQRGEQERASYAATLAADLAHLERYADTPAKRALLGAEFDRYRQGYRTRYTAYLAARGRVISVLVTGAARFPSARNQKRNATADKRTQELIDYREAAVQAIYRKLRPELAPIMAGDVDALDRLRQKLATLIATRDHEKRCNVALRKAARARERELARPLSQADHLALIATLDAPDWIRRGLESAAKAFPWLPQFGPGTSAEIRRVEQRIATVGAAKAAPAVESQGAASGIRVEEVPADNRIRIYFPGKPDATTRGTLKGAGFRWAPSIPGQPWQAYPGHRARQIAHAIAGIAAPAAAPAAVQGAACACLTGGSCDVAHDPQACACGRCA